MYNLLSYLGGGKLFRIVMGLLLVSALISIILDLIWPQ